MRVKKAVGIAVNYVRRRRWRQSHPNFLFVFNWHQIAPVFDPSRHHRYTWTPLDLFEREIDYLATEFRILPLHEAIECLKHAALRGACASLTFDDGDASNADYVLPSLRRKNLPATFFINTAYLDGGASYWFPLLAALRASADPCCRGAIDPGFLEEADKLRETSDPSFYNDVRTRVERLSKLIPNLQARSVPKQWLAELDGEQFTIGAHGHEHQRFSMMTTDWQRNDLNQNVQILSQFRAFRPIFAVPFGRPWDWTKETLRIAHDLGLDVVLANGGINLTDGDYYLRIPSDHRHVRSLIRAAMGTT